MSHPTAPTKVPPKNIFPKVSANIMFPYTLAIRFQSSRHAPATQLTPSHAKGRSAKVISKLRLIPTLLRVESTISLAQQLSLLIWLFPF